MLGHVAQSVGGALPGQSILPTVRMQAFPLGASTFTAPVDGFYTFYLRGGAGSGRSQNGGTPPGGGGGAYARKTVFLPAGAQVPISVGSGGPPVNSSNGAAGSDTTAQLPGGTVIAGGGAGGSSGAAAGGIATGGDVNVNGGSANLQAGGDAAADPVMQPFRSGLGAVASTPSISGQDGAGGSGSNSITNSAIVSGGGGHGALTVIWQQ